MNTKYIFIAVVVLGLLGLGFTLIRPSSSPATFTETSPQSSTQVSKQLGNFQRASSDEVKVDGKAHLLMFGAQFCPFCATERWALKVATERFGKWESLGEEKSAGSNEPFLNIPTYNFHDAKFTSDLISFTHVDYSDRSGQRLENPDALTTQLVNKFNTRGSIPFVLIGGQFSQVGPGFSPTLLQGKSFSQVSSSLTNNPNSEDSKAINKEANIISAYLCKLTGGQPVNTCETPDIKVLTAQIK